MKTVFSHCASGHEPYLIAAGVGKQIGEVVVPQFPTYKAQPQILADWYGKDPKIFLDQTAGQITDKLGYHGDYREFIKINLREGENVKKELIEHLRDFEAVSLTGTKKQFKNPEIGVSIGAVTYVPHLEKTHFIYPCTNSEIVDQSPYHIEGKEEFVKIARKEEEQYKRVFIPEINTFSYKSREMLHNEVSTPPLKGSLINQQNIEKGIFYNISGTGSELNTAVLDAVKKSNLVVYKPSFADGPGIKSNPDVIFNSNCIAMVARAGWGTMWMCQRAEKPIIAPAFKENDDPETYHNNITIEKVGLGVVFDDFDPSVIERALARTEIIKGLNKQLEMKFGTLDGLQYVAQKIQED